MNRFDQSDPFFDRSYVPAPGDRVIVAHKDFQHRGRYYAHVCAFNPTAKIVTIYANHPRWGDGDRMEIVPLKRVRLCPPDPLGDPPEAGPIGFDIRFEPGISSDVPAIWILTTKKAGWTNTYNFATEAEMWEHLSDLLTSPRCQTCGCQLAMTSTGRIVCQRSLDHAQPKEFLDSLKGTTRYIPGRGWETENSVSIARIEPSPLPPAKSSNKLAAWAKRHEALWEKSQTKESYTTDDGRVVERPVYFARLPIWNMEKLQSKRFNGKQTIGVPPGGVFPYCDASTCGPERKIERKRDYHVSRNQ